MDASMAAENLMLKATELGLGTCAIKSYNDTAVRKILELPDRYRIEMHYLYRLSRWYPPLPEASSGRTDMLF